MSFGFRLIAAFGILLGVSACGGSSTGGAMVTSLTDLIGVSAETGVDPQLITLLATAGNATNSLGLSLDIGGYRFDSDNGFEDGVAIENGNTIGLFAEMDLPIDTELRLYDGAYDPGDGVVGIYYGILGSELSRELPSTGEASWTGSSFANLVSGGNRTNLGIGTSTVVVQWSGTMSATLSDLNGAADTIKLSGLTIEGSRFVGDDIITLADGNPNNLVGEIAEGSITGVFSGQQDAAGVPDEVGGLFTLIGSDATLIGGFLAD